MKETRETRSKNSVLRQICREHYLEDASYRLKKRAEKKKSL